MKLAFLELVGFRGYRKALRIDFADAFTIIDGRNGTGKSTVFDAIEFALTGALGKYDDQKASGETFADYVWWKGEGPAPEDRYVKVGFRDDDGEVSVLRTEFEAPPAKDLEELTRRLCDKALAPSNSLSQLCTNAIMRDEHITRLSLDLKETDRYALLRDALGANDADAWIQRGARLVAAAKQRTVSAQQVVTLANEEAAAAARRLDEVRASLVAESAMAEVVRRLQDFAKSTASAEKLAGPARQQIGELTAEVEKIRKLAEQWNIIQTERARLPDLAKAVDSAATELQDATAALAQLSSSQDVIPSSALANDARNLIALTSLGRRL